jgi:hypothetical protein
VKKATLLLVLLATLLICAIHWVTSSNTIHGVESITGNKISLWKYQPSKEHTDDINTVINSLWDPHKNAQEKRDIISNLKTKIPTNDYDLKLNHKKPLEFTAYQVSKLIAYALGTQNKELATILCKSTDARIMCQYAPEFFDKAFGLPHLFACQPNQIYTFSSWLINQKQYEDFAFLLQNAKVINALLDAKKNALDLPKPFDQLFNTDWVRLRYDLNGTDALLNAFYIIYRNVKLNGLPPSEQDKHLIRFDIERVMKELRLLIEKTKISKNKIMEIGKYLDISGSLYNSHKENYAKKINVNPSNQENQE